MSIEKRIIAIFSAILIPNISFAFFCPTNFNQIDFGMTMDQVAQICGKPVTQKESKKQNDNIPQEWTYFVPQSVGLGGPAQQQAGSLRTSVTFDDQGKAVNISVNGIGVGASKICGSNIQLGDSRDTIKTACGKPSFINKQSADVSGPQQEVTVTEFNYSTATPPAVLIFENGILTDRK